MTELRIENLGRVPLHVLELWGDPKPAAKRLAKALGHALPRAGQAEGTLMRFGPHSWLVEGDTTALGEALGQDGALTAVGGGLVKVRLSGKHWRSLLMESALFDSESADFSAGCVATTLIEHVTVTLRVESDEACLAYVPASHAADLLHFWTHALVLI